MLDEDDRRLLHALQLDGRVPFARLGVVLNMSERAVARRYHRLRAHRGLRVVGVRSPGGPEDVWFLQIALPANSVERLSRALVQRRDTSWIAGLAGDGSLICMLRGWVGSGILQHLREALHPGTLVAQQVLVPFAGVGGWPGRLEALTRQEREALARPPAPLRVSPATQLDQRLLELLAVDGRMPVARIATDLTVPESTVRRRIADLIATGSLLFEVDIDPALYGRTLDVICWIDVQPSGLETAMAALQTHPEVAFASTTSGTTGVLAFLELTEPAHLHRYLTEHVAAIPGVRHVRTEPVGRWFKRAASVPHTRSVPITARR